MSHAQTQATLHRQGPAWTMYGAYVPRCSKAASRRWLKLDPAGWILTQGWKSAGKPTANHEQFESAHVMPSGAGLPWKPRTTSRMTASVEDACPLLRAG
jgi:hypothetical protein